MDQPIRPSATQNWKQQLLHHFGVTEMHRSELFGLIFSVDGFARGAPPALRKSRLWHGTLRADVTSSTDQKLNMFGRGGR